MGTTVDGLAVVSHHRGRRRALGLTDAAARTALDGAGLTPDDVDLLINLGNYHDRLLGELALAALIQEDIGAHPEDPHDGDHGTFSFDVANGACGLLTGLRVAHGFLAAGTIRHALVVAGDANPGRRLTRHFPFAPAGAALACGWADGPARAAPPPGGGGAGGGGPPRGAPPRRRHGPAGVRRGRPHRRRRRPPGRPGRDGGPGRCIGPDRAAGHPLSDRPAL